MCTIKGEILWKGNLPLLDGQTDYKYRRFTVMALTVLETLPTSTWQFHHPGNLYPLLPDCSIILGTTTHINLTVPSSYGQLSTSSWLSHHPGDHHPRLLDSSIILGITTPSSWQLYHPVDHNPTQHDWCIILGITAYLNLTVPLSYDQLPISIWQFKAGMGRDFVPGYPSPYYLRVPVTIAFWACPQLENIHLNET